MRFVILFAPFPGAYCALLAAGPLLRFAAAKLPVVPLWKVIVGSRAGKLQPDPPRVRFLSFAIGANHIALLSKPATAHVAGACAKTKARISSMRGIARRTCDDLDHTNARRDLHWARDQRLPAGRVLSPDALASVLNWGASPPSSSARRQVGGFRNGIVVVPYAAWRGREIRACGRGRRPVWPLPATVRTGS
jgi:hypothetical protein